MSRYPQTPYDVIYLQYFEGGEPAPEISWCEDKINDDDIKYVKNGVPATYVRELEAVVSEAVDIMNSLLSRKGGEVFINPINNDAMTRLLAFVEAAAKEVAQP